MTVNSYICPDLLYLILMFLPVQVLLKCRSVSKPWKLLIDSPSFILDHLSLQKPRILLKKHCCIRQKQKRHTCVCQQNICIYDQKYSFEYILLDAEDGRFYATLKGPDGANTISSREGSNVNGVICVFDNDKNIVLWNPSIRRQLKIPFPVKCHRWNRRSYSCGFWMDMCSKEFKVVILAFRDKRISLYSSRKKEWVEFAMSIENLDYCQNPQVLIQNVAYWTAFYRTTASGRGGAYVLVFFDFGRDEFGKIDLPFDRRECFGVHVSVCKWQGLLSVVYTNLAIDGYVVYMMENQVWSIKAKFEMNKEISSVLHVQDLGPRVLGLTTGEKELVLYDTQGERCTRVHDLPSTGDFKCLFSFASDFVETLVFPH